MITHSSGSRLHAIIVEPRAHPALSLTLCNLFQVLGEPEKLSLQLTIFHGIDNRDFVQDAICEAGLATTSDDSRRDSAHITLTELPGVRNLTVPEYSRLLTTTEFWRRFEAAADTHMLVFQTDSILSETSSYNITDFLDFAYVGAPWRHLPRFHVGGNGGLSLRNTAAMIQACQCFAQDPFFRRGSNADLPEDLKFAYYFQARSRKQYVLPDRRTSALFSVESIYSPRPLGIHKAWARLSSWEWQTLKKQDPWFAEIECWQGGTIPSSKQFPKNPLQNSKP